MTSLLVSSLLIQDDTKGPREGSFFQMPPCPFFPPVQLSFQLVKRTKFGLISKPLLSHVLAVRP